MKSNPIVVITVALFSVGFWFAVASAPASSGSAGGSLPRLEISAGVRAEPLGLSWSTSAILEEAARPRREPRPARSGTGWVERYDADLPREYARGGLTAVRVALRVARALMRNDHRGFPW